VVLNRPLVLFAVLLLYATVPAVAHLFSWGDRRRSLAALIIAYSLGAAYFTNMFHACKALAKDSEHEPAERSKCHDIRIRHDLRNSINVIMGFADLLSTETVGALNKKQQNYVHNIGAGARQMLAVVDSKNDSSGNEKISNSSTSDQMAQV
jgi:light-regulated signal transduction histidine kinase (bacteriophytochrome)